MRCVLIIATIGRTEQVARLLASLDAQTHRAFRVVLVDQNADERLAPIVAGVRDRIAVEHLRVPSRGVSAARNAGWPHLGDAEVVAFPDDDCWYEPQTLELAVAAFVGDARLGAVIGVHAYEQGGTAGSGPPGAVRSRRNCIAGSVTFVQFFRRSAVDAAGRFDESLGPGAGTPWLCGEDTDYLVRVFDTGAVVERRLQIRVLHPMVDASFAGYQAKAFGYGRGRIRMLRNLRFPAWFVAANVLHPLLRMLWSDSADRAFRWHLFRGRLHEWLGRQ